MLINDAHILVKENLPRKKMRNLRLSDHTSEALHNNSEGLLCVNPITSAIYHINKDGLGIIKGDSEGSPQLTWSSHDIQTSKIVQADFVTAINVLCIVTNEGDVFTVNTENQEVEVVGSVSAGLDAACWSPDQELLVLVTRESSVVMMTAEFDPLIEFPLNHDGFGESEFINIGWGKKETQFHGQQGKAAAKSAKSTVVPVSELDDLIPRISWCGDGEMFAVSYVTNESKCRRIRVINNEGVLQYTSEETSGLEQALSWKPSGSLIASSQRFPNKHDIVFFEKNGLRHGEFSLPFKPSEVLVKEVLWNQDSTVLIVWLEKLENNAVTSSIIQLWTTGNYHWYLKQELRYNEKICHICWDYETPLILHLLTATQYYCYRWSFHTDVSQGLGVSDLAQVGVIDGTKLKMTPFRQAVVPPPMSAYVITFQECIQAVMFAPSVVRKCEASPDSSLCVEDSGFLEAFDPPGCNSNNLCVVHGSGILTFLTQAHASENLDDQGCGVQVTGAGGNGFTVKVKVHRVFAQHQIEWESQPKPSESTLLYNWLWVSKSTMIAFYKEEISFLAVIDLQSLGSEAGRTVVRTVLPLEDKVLSVASAPDGSMVVLQLASGALVKADLGLQKVEPYEVDGHEVQFPTVCQKLAVCPINEGTDIAVLGLTRRSRLYWGDKQLLPNCTSFHIHNSHLLVTTSSHLLLIIPLMQKAFEKLLEGKIEGSWAVSTRKVERGSQLVTAVPLDMRVVLQMPRGNLEVISPRPLAVHLIKRLLTEHNYHQAIDIMRKQRVDLNLLYDHNPEDFFKHAIHFVQNIDNAHWLDLFIANLSEVDVTNTMYSFNYSEQRTKKSYPQSNKIDAVCTAVREAMMKVNQEKFLLPILTSYVKMTKSQMDVALRRVQELKDTKDNKHIVSAEEGLRHLLYIADVNELFDVALGTYDFDLVMMVAEKSQKDPKEYLPFLNELKKLEEDYMKFKINVHLRRFRKALECISHGRDHMEECMNLIVSENLYRDALQIFANNHDMHYAVCESYASYLMSRQHYNEAGMMYMRAQRMEDAMNAYKMAGNWKMVLVVGAKLKLNKEEMTDLCYALVENLIDKRLYADAAWIYEDYMKNEEEAVDLLVKASQWEDALRVAYRYGRPDLVDTNIKPGCIEQGETCLHELDRLRDTFTHYCSRLETAREVKEKQHLDILEGKGEANLDSDLYSDTSTVTGISYTQSHTIGSRSGSSMSGKTFRSSKNRKKLERKKYSTKEGSAYEDLGLVVALYETITTVDQMATSVTALATILVTFGMDLKAAELQTNFSALLDLIDKNKKKIWPPDVQADEDEPLFGPHFTTNGAVNLFERNDPRHIPFAAQRMKELEPCHRHPPPITRPKNWALHLLKQEK